MLCLDPVREGFLNSRDFGVLAGIKRKAGDGGDDDDDENDQAVVKDLSFVDEDTIALVTGSEAEVWQVSEETDVLKRVSGFKLPVQRPSYNLPKVSGEHLIYSEKGDLVVRRLLGGAEEVKRLQNDTAGYQLLDAQVVGSDLIFVSHTSEEVVRTKLALSGDSPAQRIGVRKKKAGSDLLSPRLCSSSADLLASVNESGNLVVFDFASGRVSESESSGNLSLARWGPREESLLCLAGAGGAVARLYDRQLNLRFSHDGHRDREGRDRAGVSKAID